MKIQSLTTGLVGYSTRVREKQDPGSSGQSDDQQSNSQSRQESQTQDNAHSGEENSPSEVTAEKLEQAVEAFQTDRGDKTSGLNASVTGAGPGLKVVLKDAAGSVIRSLTGEEFLRLQDATHREGQPRGKILDQKL